MEGICKDQLKGVVRVIMSTGLVHKHPRPFPVERDPCACGTHICMAAPGVLSLHTLCPGRPSSGADLESAVRAPAFMNQNLTASFHHTACRGQCVE